MFPLENLARKELMHFTASGEVSNMVDAHHQL